MVKDTCLNPSLTAAQSLVLRDFEDYHRLQRLNNNNRKEVIQTINKTVYQTWHKDKINSTKRFYSLLQTREYKNHLNRSYG
jgi:hypothetical protein